MSLESQTILKGYHYLTSEWALNRINEQGLVPKTDRLDISNLNELIKTAKIGSDIRKFLGIPSEAYGKVIKALLEPKPDSWKNNPQYPDLWERLMWGVFHYSPAFDWPSPPLYADQKLVLLEVDLLPEDEAYVLEENFMREIHHFQLPVDKYTKKKAIRSRTNLLGTRANQIRENIQNYWNSRRKISDYQGDYRVPILEIGNAIPPDRLRIHSVTLARDIREIGICISERSPSP